MADTMRSLSELIALLADNVTGDISPQDVRDLMTSLTPPFGGMYVATPAETAIAVAGTYVKVAGTTAATTLRNFTHSSGRLTYTGRVDQHFHIASHIGMTAAGNNKLISFKLAKNGTVIDESKLSRQIGTGADVGAMALHWDAVLTTNDYLELWAANDTDTVNLTADQLYLFAMGMLL